MSRDIVGELSAMMSEEKRKAFDAGCLSTIDSIILLAEISGGRISIKALRELKTYTESQFNERDQHAKGDAQEAQPGGGLPSATGLHFTGADASYLATGESPPTGEGQASEGSSQAKSG